MRTGFRVALMLLIVGVGAREARAQTDDGWWPWAAPLVTSDGRVAVPRPREPEAGPSQRPTGRQPTEGAPESGRGRRAQEAQGESGRGRGAQADAAGRGRGQAPGNRGRGRANGNGGGEAGVPAFCRSGAGHPVFGWDWCAERGFARYRPQWQRETWGEAVPRWPDNPREGRVDSGRLGGILGDIVFGRVRQHADQLGAQEPLEARWVRAESGALVLQVRAGDLPVAEFSDTSGNRRPDLVVVNRTPR